MRMAEHDRQFHPQAGEIVDIEEPAIIDFVAGDAVIGGSPVLSLDQGIERLPVVVQRRDLGIQGRPAGGIVAQRARRVRTSARAHALLPAAARSAGRKTGRSSGRAPDRRVPIRSRRTADRSAACGYRRPRPASVPSAHRISASACRPLSSTPYWSPRNGTSSLFSR